MNLTRHFSLAELTVSDTAARDGIAEQFNPPPEIVENLTALANQLEVVRILLGSKPILISSGYRCKALNDRISGSSNTSAHMLGLAADFTCPGFGTPIDICRRIVATSYLEFDQVIYEYGRWVHFGFGGFNGKNRRQALSKFSGDHRYHVGIIEKPEPLAS